MRVGIYEDLHAINQASQEIMKRIKKLRDAGALFPHFAEIHLIMTEQNCSELNVSVTNHLTTVELEDAGRLQQEGLEKRRELAETDTIKSLPPSDTMDKGQEHEATTAARRAGEYTVGSIQQHSENRGQSPEGSDPQGRG